MRSRNMESGGRRCGSRRSRTKSRRDPAAPVPRSDTRRCAPSLHTSGADNSRAEDRFARSSPRRLLQGRGLAMKLRNPELVPPLGGEAVEHRGRLVKFGNALMYSRRNEVRPLHVRAPPGELSYAWRQSASAHWRPATFVLQYIDRRLYAARKAEVSSRS